MKTFVARSHQSVTRHLCRGLTLGLVLAAHAAEEPGFTPRFQDVTDSGILPDGGHSPGAAWADFDGDGWPDLFVTSYESTGRLYRNRGDGRFDYLGTALPDLGIHAHGCSWADFDGDGRLDLLVAKRNGLPSLLYRNTGTPVFERLAAPTIPSSTGDAVGAAWGDFNGDGYPDVFLTDLSWANRLWRNTGTGTLVPVESSPVLEARVGVGCSWGDFDNDGDMDLFVANGGNNHNSLFRNVAGELVRVTEGAIVSNAGYSTGSAWGDYDNDGDLDLYVCNRLGPNFMYRNNGDGTFTRIAEGVHVTDVHDANGCTWADYDNDGDLDLFVASFTEAGIILYRNNGNGTFSRNLESLPAGLETFGSAVVLADYDGDGFLDLFVVRWSGGNSQLLRNQGNSNRWLKLRLIGEPPQRAVLGARVWIKTVHEGVERWQMRERTAYDGWGGTSEEIHFGLGSVQQVEFLRIRWPSGKVTELRNVPANQVLTVVEQPPALEISPAGGFATFPLEVVLTSRVEGGEVRYTLDGSEPALTSPAYTGPLVLTSSTRVRARVFKEGTPVSDVVGALYLENRWKDGLPAAWRETHFGAAWFTRPDAAALADADSDGANNLQEWLAGTNPVDPGSKPQQPAPLLVLDPPGGEFELAVTVRAESPLAGAVIRYTLDGTDPGPDSPRMVENRVTLTGSATLRARAFFEGNPVSPVVETAYTVLPVPPRIVRQPAGKSVLVGRNVELDVEAAGTPPLAYQWLFNDVELPGATDRVLRLVEVQPAQAGAYRVRVSNALGVVTSEPAVLVVNIPPQILRNLESQTVAVGQSVTFTVEAAGTPPLTYEWYRNNVRLASAPNAPEYTIPAVQKTHAGNYYVRVRNAFGAVASAMATLTVTDLPQVPQITQQPAGVDLLENESTALSVTAIGTPPLAYQWFRNGVAVPGATAARLEFASLRLTDAGTYWVEVSNTAGRAVSNPAVVQVRPREAGGTVNFNNHVELAGINAPVFDADGATRLAGPAYLAQLYAGPAPDQLAPVGAAVPFRTGTGAGYVEGGVVVITTVAPGTVAHVQMRVWESARGPDFDSALRAGGAVGASAVLQIATGGAGNPPSFPADLVGLTSFRIARETEPPVVVLHSPTAGSTADDRFVLAGTATDNAAVAAVTWEWNGRAMGELALSDGRFERAGLRLVRSENRLRVTARDTAGNTASAEVLVVYEPARVLSLTRPDAVREGRRVASDLVLTSPGGVGGLTLTVRYDPERFRDPELTWSDAPALNAALTQVNLQEPGVVRATLSLPGGELPAGALALATLSLRTRSVPAAVTIPLTPNLADVADRAGATLDYGNGAEPASVEILPRRLPGDNNGNDTLDVGDASLIQRFIAQLEPARPWDVTGNDLNASLALDSGDVVKVLRVVVGLDPAPGPPGTGRAQPTQRSPRLAAEPALAVLLTADRSEAWPGEVVKLRVSLAQPPAGVSGVSFRLAYPAGALRLLGEGVKTGPAVPAGVSSLLHLDEAAGQVSFAASGAVAWSESGAVLLEVPFEVLPAGGQAARVVSLVSGQVAWDNGYEVRALAPASFELRSPKPELVSEVEVTGEGVRLAFGTAPGVRYTVEASDDLRTWTPLGTVDGTGQVADFIDTDRQERPARFYRLSAGR